MDHIRKELDKLMGKDRDLPLSYRGKKKETFTDSSVCKYFLVAFCPHDLFPNTKADLGICPKSHDEYYKKLYEIDSNKEMYKRRYEEDLMEFLERIVTQLDSRIRKALSKIDLPGESDQPREIQSRIEALNKKINFFLEQAERLGEEGRLDESEGIMKEIDKLKLQKTELTNMTENPLLQNERQMHICDVCGAMQSVNDTEKRLTIHLEGKLHTGYALIRKTLAEIKQSRDEYRKLKEKEREIEKEKQKEKENEKIKEPKPTQEDTKITKVEKPIQKEEPKPNFKEEKKEVRVKEIDRRKEDYRHHRKSSNDRNKSKDKSRRKSKSRSRSRSRSRDRDRGNRDRKRDHDDRKERRYDDRDHKGRDHKERSHHKRSHDR